MAGIINGSVYLLKIGTLALPDQTEGSISLSMETRDTTSKDSSGFRELLESTRSGSISVSGLVDEATGQAVSTLMGHFAARTSFAIVFGLDATAENNFTCATAFVTSIEASGGTEDNVTYSATIELSGSIAFSQA
jgi:TP901-1 family phage major tail protein